MTAVMADVLGRKYGNVTVLIFPYMQYENEQN
jgi:hypothetical protein